MKEGIQPAFPLPLRFMYSRNIWPPLTSSYVRKLPHTSAALFLAESCPYHLVLSFTEQFGGFYVFYKIANSFESKVEDGRV